MRLSLLQPVIGRPGPWASVYADTSHHTEYAADQQKLMARATAARLSELGADAATCDAVRAALAEVRTGEPGTEAGRALFATDGKVVLDTPLPGPPAAPFTMWGPLPRVTPLLEAVGDEPLCLLVRVDRTGADFELHRDRGGEPVGHVEGEEWPVHSTSRADWSERHFQTRVENTWEHNAEEIAEAARSTFENCGASVMLLVGDARERRAVHDKLPPQLRAVTYESDHGGRAPGAESRRLERDIAQVQAVYEREHASEVAGRFRAGAGPAGSGTPYAAMGVPALVEAAREHRVDTLLISPHSPDGGREVWVGPDPDQLAVRSSELQYLGVSRPVPARADDALLRSAVANGADAVVVRDPEQAPAGGLGAILRWSDAGVGAR